MLRIRSQFSWCNLFLKSSIDLLLKESFLDLTCKQTFLGEYISDKIKIITFPEISVCMTLVSTFEFSKELAII